MENYNFYQKHYDSLKFFHIYNSYSKISKIYT